MTATAAATTAATTAAAAAGVASESAPTASKRVQLQGGTGQLRFWPSLLTAAAHKRLFEELTLSPHLLPAPMAGHGGGGSGGSWAEAKVGGAGEGRWMQRPIKLFGKEVLQPRLTCFYGREGISYR